ncbi:MAG TPA: hypothetical protein ENH45_00015 [Nitrospirae bacterium]|nr:hypothetical protein BMS3Abin09_00068 [bacterium BMS3Abin09]GBE40205.1 hypothetical protein BMS3Bbin09_00079 [bacterium BMS3Bbin09]HDZ83578.1 hypothetical protein [Nitrospirota bacterium]
MEEFPVLFFFPDNKDIGVEEIGNAVDNCGTALLQFLKGIDRKIQKTALAFYTLVSKQYEYKENK